MKWRNPWNTDSLYDARSEINITPRAKLIGANGKVLEQIFQYDIHGDDFFPLTFDIDWKQVEEIHITVDVDYSLFVLGILNPIKHSGTGNYKIVQEWRIVYGDNGVVLEPKPWRGSSQGKGDYAVAVQLQPDQNPHEAGPTYVALQIRLVGGDTDDGISVQIKGIGPSASKNSSTYFEDYLPKINLHVRGKPATPKPAEPIVVPDDLLMHVAYFDESTRSGKAPGEDNPNLSGTELRRLEDAWIRPLQSRAPELYDVIKSGKCPITVFGYASHTASDDYDWQLSQKRIKSAEEAIGDIMRSVQLKFNEIPLGHVDATQRGPVPREKRVEILIDKQDAQRAIEASRKK